MLAGLRSAVTSVCGVGGGDACCKALAADLVRRGNRSVKRRCIGNTGGTCILLSDVCLSPIFEVKGAHSESCHSA